MMMTMMGGILSASGLAITLFFGVVIDEGIVNGEGDIRHHFVAKVRIIDSFGAVNGENGVGRELNAIGIYGFEHT